MPVRIPAIRPPDRPPTSTLTIVARPCSGGMEKVNGRVRTTAMAMVNPGMAPAISPPATPTAMRRRVLVAKMMPKAARALSMIMNRPSQRERIENFADRQHYAEAKSEQAPHGTDQDDRQHRMDNKLLRRPAAK